jgi:hypothetical protein
MAKRLADFSAEIDTLYQTPLPEFIAARNALAARVKGEQGAEAAAAIKGLQKPSIAAWVVNQLYWRDRRDFERMTKAGDRLRAAQQHRLAGHGEADDLREAMGSRQEVIAALTARAREVLRGAGLGVSPDMIQRVSTTIEALSAYGSSDAAPRAGRLVEEVAPPGLEALASLMPVGGFVSSRSSASSSAASTESTASSSSPPKSASKQARADLRVVDPRRAEKAKAAKAGLAEAEAALTEARTASETAAAAQDEADTAWTAAHRALQEARRVLDEAMDHERDAERRRDTARREATHAAHALERAERIRDAAEREYQSHAGA